MAPRNTRKAATATAQPVSDSIADVPNENEQTNNKPAKEQQKKKASKSSKKTDKNEENTDIVVAADSKIKSNKATAKKSAKQTEAIEQNGKNGKAGKVDEKSKKAPAKKNVKATAPVEQNGGSTDDEIDIPAKTDSKSKKAPVKKNTKPIEKSANKENGDAAVEPPEKGRKRKLKPDEPNIESKVKKGKSKTADKESEQDMENEAGPSNTEKKATKDKSAKKGSAKEDAILEVSEPVKKRGAKRNQSPEMPVESKKSAKGKAKKAEPAKSTNKASKSKPQQEQPIEVENVTENAEDDSAKGRKRKPAKNVTAGTSSAIADESPILIDLPKKRKADSTTNVLNSAFVTKRKRSPKVETKNEPKTKMNATTTDYSKMSFDSDKHFGLKIVSWNVAGLRALIAKDGFDYFEYEKPNIICLQEIKCVEDEVPEEAKLKGYHPYWCSTKGGRGGVAILSKNMPYNVENNIGNEEMDEEGRIITAEYSTFYLICVYVPNAGRGLVNLDRRLRWNKLFEQHVTKLKEKKPVIICGDMNVAHEEIDLANPKTNKKSAGFTIEEREGMTDLLQLGFVDTFRDLHPDQEKAYTFWTYMGGARAKNVGWRLDYSIVSENLKPKVVDSFMRPQILGSDHCPIVLLLNV